MVLKMLKASLIRPCELVQVHSSSAAGSLEVAHDITDMSA